MKNPHQMTSIQDLYKRNDLGYIEELIMKVTNYAWREMTLLEQEELRQGAYDEFVDSELELNKYKKLVNSFYETVSVNCTDVGETLAGMQNDIDQLRKETFPVNRTTNRYDPNSRHTVIGGR